VGSVVLLVVKIASAVNVVKTVVKNVSVVAKKSL
jgi:hypothetical protein